MADINHVISLGIGSPAAIPEFLTFGLQIGTIAEITVPGLEFTLPNGKAHYTMGDYKMHYTFADEDD